MDILPKNKIFNTNFYYLLLVILYSFFINFYYANLGVFPIDTFFHYDSSYRILNNEYPIRDFWTVSGLSVDLIQSIFFKIFGISWFSHILHSSFFNCLISVLIFNFFLKLKINSNKSLVYTLCFSTLAYTISGTPFVDHHAVFFLMIGSILLIDVIYKPDKEYLWFLVVLALFFSFISKQVPLAYAIIFQSPLVLYYLVKKNNLRPVKLVLLSSSFVLIVLFFLLKILDVDLNLFIDQYFNYPRSIGANRFGVLEISVETFLNKYKFILFPVLLGIIFKIYSYKKNKKIPLEKVISYLIILSLTIVLIFHQLMTKNQMFIYFLIPILFAFLESDKNIIKKKYRNIFSIFLISLVIFSTIKYHMRFNENRKFHELEASDLQKTVNALEIHQSLKGLKWINPFFNGETSQEIKLIKLGVSQLDKVNNELMLLTNYLFIDSITEKKMNYPSRAITGDGTSFPLVDNKYFKNYKNFLRKLIIKNKIEQVYIFKHESLSHRSFTNYFEKNCYTINENDLFIIVNIKCLN